MKLTGHKTEAVYRRYAIVSEGDLAEGVAKLATLHRATADQPRQVVPLGEVAPRVAPAGETGQKGRTTASG
jgi:hypothetical protein